MKAYGEVATVAAALIITARLEMGLSQRQLAALAQTSGPAIAAYESGRREPRLSTLMRILEAAGTELRMSTQPIDRAGDALRSWEDELAPEVIGAWRSDQARRVVEDLAAAEQVAGPSRR